MTFKFQMHIFKLMKHDGNPKNGYRLMSKTFTFLLLLCASLIFLPKISTANSFELSSIEVRFGEKELIKFYPNPMVSDATIKISDEIDLDRSKVSVVFYNIVGSEVYKINQVKEYDLKIIRDIFKSSGIYFYQLKIDDSVITTGRITVK